MSEIRILYVDDNPLDRELVRDALEKEHGGFRVVEATSRADFEARLAQGDYDLVLSDFNILGFEGLQVLDAVRAKNPRVPVIIVTGTGSEEVAVEAMKRGAADYVIKTAGHIQRLPLTIHAALEKKRLEEERKRAEEALAASEAELRALFASMQDVVLVIDRQGVCRKIAPTHPPLLYRPPEELLGKTLRDVFPGEEADRYVEAVQRVLESRQTASIEYALRMGERQVWFSAAITPMTKDSAVWVARDITRRKQTEEKINQQLAELQRWYEVMLEREDRNLELKRQVNDLLKRLHEPIRYSSAVTE